MADTELIEQIKVRLGLTGEYHDGLINAYADDVKGFIRDSGVNPDSPSCIGAIARGVADLWNYGAGAGTFSNVFFQRLAQLALTGEPVEKPIYSIKKQYKYVPSERMFINYVIPEYDPAMQTLDVFVNGLLMTEGTDYTMDGETCHITKDVDAGTVCLFVVKGVSV